MGENDIERRTCLRFEIPGATVSYKVSKFLPAQQDRFDEEFCPLLDISRGGMRFQCRQTLAESAKLTLNISIPGERVPLILHGKIRWSSVAEGSEFKYQIGVQFNPYGMKKGQNLVGNMVKIIELEQKFCPPDSSEREKAGAGDYEVDG